MKQIHSKTFQKKKELSIMLVLVLILGIFAGNVVERTEVKAAESKYGISNPRTDDHGVTTWDCVWFGNYWQEDTNGDGIADKNDAKQPIKWRVLSVDGDDAFLLADKNLDVQRYNSTDPDTDIQVTWETCEMRSWLNGYGVGANALGKDYSGRGFLNNAFSSAEQSAILKTNIVNDNNPVYDTKGGNITSDKVYLLSIDEVMNPAYGFTSTTDITEKRKAVNTAYVAAGGEIRGEFDRDDVMLSAGSTDYWWLRSPGPNSYSASGVSHQGYVYRDDIGIGYDAVMAVRPALHLNLSSVSNWSYAGIVTSEGGEIGTELPTPSISPVASPTNTPGSLNTQAPTSTEKPSSNKDTPSNQNTKKVIRTTGSSATVYPSRVGGVKIKNRSKKTVITWNKAKNAKYYEIQIAKNRTFSKGKKRNISDSRSTFFEGLKKNTTYFVRVRAAVYSNGRYRYGSWSAIKKVKIKK